MENLVERNHGNYFLFLDIFKRMTAYNEVINVNEWIKNLR